MATNHILYPLAKVNQQGLGNDLADTFEDGNPMLRDGVTGDWYVDHCNVRTAH